jgi:hypothetical protein
LSSNLDQGIAEHPELDASSKVEELLELSKKFYSGQNNEITKKEIIKKFSNFQFLLSNSMGIKGFEHKHEKSDGKDEETEMTLNDFLGPQTLIKGYEYLDVGEINGAKIDIDGLKKFIAKNNKMDKCCRKNIMKTNSFNQTSPNFKASDNNNIGSPIEKKNTQKKKEKDVFSQKGTAEKAKAPEKTEEPIFKSTLDTQMGFAISKVKSVYPNRFLKEHITNLDFIVGKISIILFNLYC